MVNTVLNFTIAANTQSAEAGVKRVGAAFDSAGSAAASMASKFEVTESNAARVAKSLGVELSSGAERVVAKLEGLRDHLVRTGAPAADMERVTLALAEADRKYAASLSNTVVQMGFWEQHGSAVAKTAGTMGAAILAYGVIAVNAFGESQKVAAQLDAVLESTGHAAGVTKEEVLGLADALSKVTPFDDEVITQGETLLLMFTNIGRDIFPRATKAMLDLAARMEIDVPTAAKMLGKALDQPSEGFTALAKTTGKFTDAQVNTIKEMVAMGETGKAQAAVLDLVEKKVGGAAEAMGKTLPGQLTIAKTAAENFNEEVGSKLVPTLQDLITEFPKAAAAVVGVKSAWDGLGISGGELLIAIPLLKTAFAGMGASAAGLFAASGPIALGIIAFGALAATIYTAVTAIQAFSQKQIAMVQANVTATRATEGLTKKAQEYGIALTKGNETQEQFNARLFQAIAQHEKLNKAVTATSNSQSASSKVVLSHVITLQQQIDRQRALVESLKFQKDKDEELTEATAKLEAMLKKTHVTVDKNVEAWKKLPLSYIAAREASEEWAGSGEREFEVLARLANQLGRNLTAIDKLRASTLAFSEIDLSAVMISNAATLDEAFKRVEDGARSWDKLNKMIEIDTPKSLKPAEQSFKELDRQVSTVVTDLGKGIADALVKWEGFGKSMINIAKEFGTGILRTLIETWFKPLEGLLQKAASWIQGLFGGGGGNAGAAAGGSLLGGLIGGLPMLGAGLGAGLLGNQFGGGIGGKIGGAAVGGLGAAVAAGAFAPTGAAGAVAGGAFSGIGAGALGVLSAIPIWGWAAIGASIAAGPLINKLTQRGRDKRTATGAAEDLSENFWQGTFLDVQEGRMSVDEGLAELNASWDKYVAFLNSTLKDQTVIQRSIDTQRITLTEGTAALEALRKKLKTDEAVAGLTRLGQQFLETGKMTDEFASAIQGAGGSVSFFTRVAGEVERLQGLRNELGALKQMVDSFLPKQKTWMENFIETGEITEEMAAKIREAGGDIQQFKKFAEMKQVKSQFESLVEEFGKTGVASDKLLDMIKEFGGTDAIRAFEDLQAEARRTGKTIGELAKDSDGAAKTIQDAFNSTSEGINKAFGDAAKQLSDTLAKMDENLGKAIQSLQAAMVTMIKDLIDVLLDVPGAAEKAARDANFFLGTIHDRDVRINFVASGLDEIQNRANQFGGLGGITNPAPTIDPTTVSGGGSRTSRDYSYLPQYASGTDYVPRTGLAMVHQGEAIIPAGENWGGNVTVQVMGNVVANNPEQFMDELERYLATNRDGARVRIQKALKLKQPGAF